MIVKDKVIRKNLISLAMMLLLSATAHAGSREEARLYQFGNLTLFGIARQGGWLKGKIASGDRLEFLGNDIKISKQGKFILGLPYEAKLKEPLKHTNRDGEISYYMLEIETRHYPTQRIDGLDPKKVTPPESVWARIEKEAKAARDARKNLSDFKAFDDLFIWAVQGRISGKYGVKRVLNGEKRSPHFGIDIAAPMGTLIVAPASGKVTLAHPGMYFSGRTLIIDHGHGLFSTFLHLDKIMVKQGQWVKQGEKIGTVGRTGRATGPHLDWRIHWGEENLDAELFLLPMDKVQIVNRADK